ncbi:MAG: TIGR02281 family clan AA aspartic protease [Proteobacteria bacterium]|nr:TIGR02281 family clan AA aspartic protease [Pseudomonadota bacterium]
MDPNDFPRFIYLVLLLMVVGGYALVESRKNLGKVMHQAAIWTLIFLGAIAIAGLWPTIRHAVRPTQAVVTDGGIEVPVSEDGHFYVTARVNDADVRFVVDTGASTIVLNARDAERAGFDPATLNFLGTAMTANGTVPTAPVRIARFDLEGMVVENVGASVNGGEMDTSLLGMSYLSRFEMTVSRDRLLLRR